MPSGFEGQWTHTLFVELAEMVDHERFLYLENNTSNVQEEVLMLYQKADAFHIPLGAVITVVGLEMWTQENFITMDTARKQTSFNAGIPHDVAYLTVKHSYGVTLGLSNVGTVCYRKNLCNCFRHNRLGHNLPMTHDIKNVHVAKKVYNVSNGNFRKKIQ
ncbi:Disintegrin and metalloproteinase domain-containing protein 25 [Plecturocebus cupreus]